VGRTEEDKLWEDRDKWRGLVVAYLHKVEMSWKEEEDYVTAGNFLISRVNICCSRKILFHAII
jgi:hypothetical protein